MAGRRDAGRIDLRPAHQVGHRALRILNLLHADDVRARALAVAEHTCLARDLTNTPSIEKSPEWFAEQVAKAVAGTQGLALTVRTHAQLEAEGFGGILAVGGGSTRGPRLVELGWHPKGARRHVVLVGKGITFDSGGISIKTRAGMKLMKKDMAGAAAISLFATFLVYRGIVKERVAVN